MFAVGYSENFLQDMFSFSIFKNNFVFMLFKIKEDVKEIEEKRTKWNKV